MINRKMEVCKWHKCNIGYHYHHTGEEWDQHQQYCKNDIPKLLQSNQVYDIDQNQIRVGAMPQGYKSQVKYSDSKTAFWRGVALGAIIMAQVAIIATVIVR